MSRIRTIKPSFWTHELLSALPEPTHMLAAALINYADDEGYFNANPGLVKAECCPLREPSVSIQVSLNSLVKIGYLQFGSAPDGRKYGKILTFDEHQVINRPTPSKIKELQIMWEDSRRTHTQLSEDSPPEGKGREGKGRGKEAPTADADGALLRPFLTFPLTSGKTHVITETDIALWQPAYPAVDVRQELRKVLSWLDANPDKRSVNVVGSKQRIVKWLSRAQNNGGSSNGKPEYAKNKAERTLDALTQAIHRGNSSRVSQAGDFASGPVITAGTGTLRNGAAELGDGRPPGGPEILAPAPQRW